MIYQNKQNRYGALKINLLLIMECLEAGIECVCVINEMVEMCAAKND